LIVSGLVTSPCDQERDLLRAGKLDLDGVKVEIGPVQFKGAGAEHGLRLRMFSAKAAAVLGWRLLNLFRDDFIRRIAMPLVLVLVPISIVVLLKRRGHESRPPPPLR